MVTPVLRFVRQFLIPRLVFTLEGGFPGGVKEKKVSITDLLNLSRPRPSHDNGGWFLDMVVASGGVCSLGVGM